MNIRLSSFRLRKRCIASARSIVLADALLRLGLLFLELREAHGEALRVILRDERKRKARRTRVKRTDVRRDD